MQEFHDARVNVVLAKCRKINLILNVDKSVFFFYRQKIITFLGRRVSGKGLALPPDRVSSILQMKARTR